MQCKLVLFFLFSICTFIGTAQDPVKALKEQAEQYFSHQKYPEALNLILKYQRAKSIDNGLRYKMGVCYLMTNELQEARKHLEFVVENTKKPDAKAYYYIARCYHRQQDFKKAAKAYKKFLSKTIKGHSLRNSVKGDLRRCVKGFTIKSVAQKVIVENLGEYVNSKGDDFGPVLSPNYKDKIYFSSARVNNLGGLRSEEGLVSEPFGQYKTDIFTTNVSNGQWNTPNSIGSLVNSTKNDVILGFNSNGTVMYYFKSVSLYSGETFVDTFSVDKPPVSPSRFSSAMISENGDNYPYFFNDSIMLFSSSRDGGYGGMDLYISINENGRWTLPENLGSTINSPYDEITPFLAADGRTLYFSSNSLESIGGHDIFKSVFDDRKRSWSIPENEGLPVNSADDDAFFKLSKNGMKSFFCSSRVEGYGKRDIYVGYFNAAKTEQGIRSQPLVFSQVLSNDYFSGFSGITDDTNGDTGLDIGFNEDEITSYELEALTYLQADNVLTPANSKKLNQLARLLLNHPQVKVELESHSDITGPSKFDLYFSAKRGETVADYLIGKGVSPSNILIKGCGVNYPIAKGETESGVNERGKNLNKRIYLRFHNTSTSPVRINVANPQVGSYLQTDNWALYNKSIKGLSYKVQVAAMKQMYNGEAISLYPNATIETTAQKENYRYTVGLYKSFYSADVLRKELERSGVNGCFVVPYINGLRATVEDAKIYTTAFPDLENYLTGIGEN